MPLIDDFKARFPALSAVAIDATWANLEKAWPRFYGFEYGSSEDIDEIILQLIAHLFVVASSPTSGPVMAKGGQSVGSVSVTWNTPPAASQRQSFFGSTQHGQMFLILTVARQGAFFV